MPSLRQRLAEALGVHGYACSTEVALEGRSGDVHTADILAEGDDNIIFDVQADAIELTTDVVAELQTRCIDLGADRIVLVHQGDALAEGDVVAWGPEQVAEVLGQAVWAEATGNQPRPLVWKQRVSFQRAEMMPESSGLQAPMDDGEEEVETRDLEAVFGAVGGGALEYEAAADEEANGLAVAGEDEDSESAFIIEQVDTAGDTDEDAYPASLPEPEPEPERRGPDIPVMERRVGLDQAMLVVKDRLFGVDHVSLILQPVWRFDYECDLFLEGSLRSETVSGRVLVNGTNRATDATDPMLEAEEGVTFEHPFDERTLRVSADRAMQEATRYVRDLHTRMVDVAMEDPDANYSFIEKRRVSPRPEHIRLKPLPLAHRPSWKLTGNNGTAVVDAVTGDLTEQAILGGDTDSFVM